MKEWFAVPARSMVAIIMLAVTTTDADAAIPKDSVYIHCRNEGGDLRISDLNHSVSRYSQRYGDYRPLCVLCNITEWGNIISMDDGARMSVRIDRLKGYVSIKERSDDGDEDGAGQLHLYHGACVRGQMMTDHPSAVPHRVF